MNFHDPLIALVLERTREVPKHVDLTFAHTLTVESTHKYLEYEHIHANKFLVKQQGKPCSFGMLEIPVDVGQRFPTELMGVPN